MPTRETTPSISARVESGKAASAALSRGTAPAGNSGTEFSDEELHELVAQAAYRRAEKRAFAPGRELDDWLEAEAEIREAFGMSG